MSEPARSGFTLTPLRSVTARRVAHDWPWAHANADDIERNWRRRRAAQPDLFDGTVLLCNGCEVRDGACEARFFEVSYSQFLAFRDAGSPDGRVVNAFAAIVPCTADGAVLLGEMAAHTANAGQVYFPCGTPDRADVLDDGRVDLFFSAAREFTEETGLALPPAIEAAGPETTPWLLARGDGQCAFLRTVRFPDTAEAVIARIEAFRRTQDPPELAGIVVARNASDIDAARMPGFVRAYLGSVFGEGQR